ncbi:MAG TPA: transglutaminase-like domain-containing protein [Longimicrobiales bacterium]|nr:transglutaminase-like domain-containing protein [Longimicrobiales bacterium]
MRGRGLGKRTAATAIVLSWLGMVAWQVRSEYFQPELTRLAEATLSLAPGTHFYTLTMGGRTVGQASSRLDTVPDGFVLEDFMNLELPALGQTGAAVARTSVRVSRALVMEEFAFTLDSEVGRFRASGTLGPDTTLHVSIESAGSEQNLSFRLAEPPVISSIVPIRVAMGGALEVGETVRLPVFDPTSLSTRTVEVQVLEHDTLVVADSASLDTASGRWSPASTDSVPAWRIAEVFGGIRVESWVDADGRVLKASSPLGFTMDKTEFELARQALQDVRLAGTSVIDEDVILATAVQSDVDLEDVEQYDELRFRLTGVDLSGFELDGGRQELRGDTLIVRRERWDDVDPGYMLPYARMDLREALEPEPLIQSDDERIIRRARQITDRRRAWGQERDPKEVASRLTTSVYDMLEKRVTFSMPNAVQVLETRQGDCNEHTVLYVALARALGLPARTAVGLVYLDGSFFYHAWPEVWLGEWVAVDPTFGQLPADAAHIRFVIGGLAQQVEIVRLIGNLDIEILTSDVEAE